MSALWSGWGADPFSEQVEKATSELLPAGQEDIALNLDICDQVRAKQVQPKQAMQVIKRRVSHKNPNVVLLALGLTDICIKNGGDHFLQEVASREFMDNLVSVLQNPAGVNHDVKAKALGLIQNWAQIAEQKPSQMGYINDVYRTLKGQKFDFPPRDPHAVASAALVETLTAPEWVDGDVCLRCRTAFTTFNRKHHCRNCGNVFCQQCSSHSMSLPWFGIGQDVRVCDACHTRRAPPKNAAKLSRSKSVTSPSRSSSLSSSSAPSGRGGAASHQRSLTVGGKPRRSGRSTKEDDDLALAIKLSLESSGGAAGPSASGPGQTPSAPGRATRQPDGRMLEGTDADDDPDLAAAIAASLRDWAPPQPSAPDSLPASQPQSYATAPAASAAAADTGRETLNLPPSLELPPQDVDSLLTFAQTVQAQEVYNQRHGISGAPPHQQAQALYEKASTARPKVARSLEEGHRRHGVLVSMHEKLAEAVRLYDRLLDAQMTRPAASYAPYGQPQGAYYGQDPRREAPSQSQPVAAAGSGMYPNLPPSGPSASTAPYAFQQGQHGQPYYADPAAYYSHQHQQAQHPHQQLPQQQLPQQHAPPPQDAGPYAIASTSTTPQPRHHAHQPAHVGYGAAPDSIHAAGSSAAQSPVHAYATATYPQSQPQQIYPNPNGEAYAQHASSGYGGVLAANQVGAHPTQPQAYGVDGYGNAPDATSQHYYAGSQTHTPQPGLAGGSGGAVAPGPPVVDGGYAQNAQVYEGQGYQTTGLGYPRPGSQQQQQQPQAGSLEQATMHVNGFAAQPGEAASAQRRRSTDTLASSSTGWNNVPIEQVSPASATAPMLNGNGIQHPPANGQPEQRPPYQQQQQQQQQQATAAPPAIKTSMAATTTTTQPGAPYQQQAPSSNASYLPIFPVAPHPENGLGPSSSQSELVSPASANTNGRSSAGMWQQPSSAHPQAVGESPLIEF
ncbi:related to VPS27 - vacuolar protein sorting-associated protein [Pseudozyma flocculosa]|uniref:Vacuolar protein sorting-associated protein 27 n=1 Tax=Pseudozyma flocculosa TaxID=84751 RepID=A0A5C3ETT5_9BASI|nr:related to VPS27 - vacuolar protein sorting-associated protein [Pseudozyma flocculosa]